MKTRSHDRHVDMSRKSVQSASRMHSNLTAAFTHVVHREVNDRFARVRTPVVEFAKIHENPRESSVVPLVIISITISNVREFPGHAYYSGFAVSTAATFVDEWLDSTWRRPADFYLQIISTVKLFFFINELH